MTKAVRLLASTLLATAFFAAATHAQAQAQTYPSQPIRIVVPYAPGGFNDTIARLVGRKLQEAWGQPAVADNRPGGGTTLGLSIAAKSPPDGYTLTVVGFPTVANQFLIKKLPYDTNRDFTPVILGAFSPNLLVVKADSPIKSMKDFIAAAQAKPGKMNYATAGNGTSNHLTMEYFKSIAGIDLVQVPYKGSAPMITDLIGGQVDIMFDNAPHVMPHVKGGRLRALAITSEKRSPLLPDVPTVAELGYPGFSVAVWYGFAAPAGTPADIVQKLNREINKVLQADDVKKAFTDAGVEALGGTTQQYDTFFKAESARWGKVIKQANIVAD
ncbi:tripartite tricarboxylate transporter substrate binding protein [Lacisediminimonas profundi]|uniref:tripartite tricarboxylate transporter substrate binding protein n=1 Tax=Lacisediminimonas profundi TaxID=2603856 RepID=UPI001F4FDB36|nr:tripartite tricarboxylate transporter substrate binding protein [Lacisediminimonas profundi]